MTIKHKVVLYNPVSVFYDMPLALIAIGSALDPEKYEVIIIDGRMEDPIPLLEKHLPEALCFGVTSLTGSPLKDAIKISKFAKQLVPQCPVIWGGWHTSLFPTQPLKDLDCIDITVQGQGEITFIELVEAILNKTPLEDVDGISYRNSQGIAKRNKARVLGDLNDLPVANYELIDVEKYFEKKGKRQFDYISSAGCFFRCTFCADPFVFNRKFKAIDADIMVRELKKWQDKYHFTDVNFQDETFFTYQKRINEITQGLIDHKLNISWAATMRADQGMRMTEEELLQCKKSGLRRVLIGVESGSEEMLLYLKKDIKLPQIMECADRCKKHGINVIFPFIVGFPDESPESVVSSVQLIKKLRGMSDKFDTPIFYFKPYPGTEITREVEAQGFKLPTSTIDWADFDYVGSRGPWVDDEKFTFFENFKFYLKLAHKPAKPLFRPLKYLAKKRIEKENFIFPIERIAFEKLIPTKKLS